MASTSIQQAVTDLYTLVNTSISGVTKVYDYEPTAPVDNGVTITATGVGPDEYRIALRVYVKLGDARDSQQRLWSLIENVDNQVDTSAQFGPSEWTISYVPDVQVFVAENVLTTGRQDF